MSWKNKIFNFLKRLRENLRSHSVHMHTVYYIPWHLIVKVAPKILSNLLLNIPCSHKAVLMLFVGFSRDISKIVGLLRSTEMTLHHNQYAHSPYERLVSLMGSFVMKYVRWISHCSIMNAGVRGWHNVCTVVRKTTNLTKNGKWK